MAGSSRSAVVVESGIRYNLATPDYYHVPVEAALLQEAADLIEREQVVQPCIHLHVHDGNRVLLEWHDAFDDDPIHIASVVPRDRIDLFVRAIGVGPVSRRTPNQ